MITGIFILIATNLLLVFCLIGARYLNRLLERDNALLRKQRDAALRGFSR